MQKTDSENLACGSNEQIPVSTLEGALLDYWVARAEGLNPILDGDEVIIYGADHHGNYEEHLFYQNNWETAGVIIEREGIELQRWSDGTWGANVWPGDPERSGNEIWSGPTPLIAAMRAYVASKFGESVPKEIK